MPKSSSSHHYATDKSSPLYLRPRKLFVDDDTADNDLNIRHSKSSNHIITTALARLTTRTPPSSSHHTVVIRTTVQQTPLSAHRKLQMIDVNVCQQDNHLSIKRIKRQTLNTCSPLFNKSTPVPIRRVSEK
jgi:hypothetical protein